MARQGKQNYTRLTEPLVRKNGVLNLPLGMKRLIALPKAFFVTARSTVPTRSACSLAPARPMS